MTTHMSSSVLAPASPQSDARATREHRHSGKAVVHFHLAYWVPDLIRDRAVTPRFGGLLHHVRPGYQAEFVTLAADIWHELRRRFAAPLALKR